MFLDLDLMNSTVTPDAARQWIFEVFIGTNGCLRHLDDRSVHVTAFPHAVPQRFKTVSLYKSIRVYELEN